MLGGLFVDYAVFDKLCKEKNTTPTALALKLGLSKGNTSSWKKGGNPSADVLIKIADELDCTIDLLLGRLKKRPSSDNLSDDEQKLINIYKGLSPMNKGRLKERAEMLAEMEMPVLNEPVAVEEPEEHETIFIEFSTLKVSAGSGEPLIDDSYPDFIEVKKSNLTENANFAVKVNGESMMPHFKNGDIVLVRSQPYVNIGEIGIFVIDGNGYIKERGDDRLISINPRYDDIYFEEGQDIRCKGLVIGTLEEDDFV